MPGTAVLPLCIFRTAVPCMHICFCQRSYCFCQRSYCNSAVTLAFLLLSRTAAGVTLLWTEDRKRFSTWTPGDRWQERSRTIPCPTEGGQAAPTALKAVTTALKWEAVPTPTVPKPPKVPLRRNTVTPWTYIIGFGWWGGKTSVSRCSKGREDYISRFFSFVLLFVFFFNCENCSTLIASSLSLKLGMQLRRG